MKLGSIIQSDVLGNSSSSNDTLHPHPSSFPSDLPLDMHCFISSPSSFNVSTFYITNIFIFLPLCIYILHHGIQQWRHKSSTSSSASPSHSDCFTYHMVTIELIGVLGCFFGCCGIFSHHLSILQVGFYLYSFTWAGQVLFNVLTCLERYLAVVHPINYLSLRHEKGIKLRNISIGCAWLVCFVNIGLLVEDYFIFFNFGITILSVTIVSFCSLSVLCILIRPGPGEQGKGRARVDQSKQRAFYTIVAILGVLVVRFAWGLTWAVLFVSKQKLNCMVMTSDLWFNLPSSLVAPLLFLHRKGKIMSCNQNQEENES